MALGYDHLLLGFDIFNEINNFEQRQTLRLEHRRLRDNSNPFEIPDNRFKKIFRLNRELALNLCERLDAILRQPRRSTYIPNYLKVLLTLNFYAYGSYQGIVGEDYNFPCSQPTTCRIIDVVTNAIIRHVMPEKIVFPTTNEAMASVKYDFFRKYGFPDVIGCIDGTHIAIISPPLEHDIYPGAAYYNRKGYTSLNVQIICDSNLKITSINARYPGSTHDAAIWQMSNVHHFLQNKYNLGELRGWLLGDSGYPLQPWLLTPVLDVEEDSPEGRYTTCHCRTRNAIERLNGVLKTRFRCLLKHRTLHYSPPKAGKIIYACATLHNMCIERNIDVDENIEIENDEDNEERNNNHIPVNGNILAQGQRKRAQIINNYFQ